MADLPIIFSAPMVRALLAGRKTQTRRIFTPPPPFAADDDISVQLAAGTIKPRYAPGDRLYVREAFRFDAEWDDIKPSLMATYDAVHYEADGHQEKGEWGDPFKPGRLRPPMFMPRWASRLTLTVTEVRVQRLQDISHEDAVAEGMGIFPHSMSAQKRFREIWNSLHGPDAWQANPWVCAISFTVQHGNIDEVTA